MSKLARKCFLIVTVDVGRIYNGLHMIWHLSFVFLVDFGRLKAENFENFSADFGDNVPKFHDFGREKCSKISEK